MDKQDLSGYCLCCLFVKILKYFEECSSFFVNLLTSLFTVFSVAVKANLYLSFLYLIRKTAVQKINLCMKLQWRSWFGNSLLCMGSKFSVVQEEACGAVFPCPL